MIDRNKMTPSYARPTTRVHVGKVPFDVATMSSAVGHVIEAAETRNPLPVRLSNAYCVALASRDPNYAALLNGPGLNYPDGAPVAWFMKARNDAGIPLSRVRGPSFFSEVLAASSGHDLKHFFLGTTDETLALLSDAIGSRFPDTKSAGSYAPPFAPVTDSFLQDCEDRIRLVGADVVWVGLGTPKQDYVAAELAVRLGVPCIGVGAAFDFLAGTVPEAPKWVQRSGTEWFYRLVSEPRRLWKRYLFGNVRFLYSALAESGK
ncbi:WecB/TagA/CpsF family glycosyltransferase [Rhodococcus pyridinivorans]|uniref:WecB/TagA/CpsF family glycosyltransferase n=1 Tax=Rhodococcus pyridinivorans TaxID=103816 RepID=UPI003D7FC2AD